MALRNVFHSDFQRLVRAMVVDNASANTYGVVIDNRVNVIISPLSTRARGYKIEESGVMYGYYIIDYTTQGIPYVANFALRKVFINTAIYNNIVQQLQIWSSQEYPILISA